MPRALLDRPPLLQAKENPPTEEYLTPEDLAALLKVSINTVRAWRRLGKLPTCLKLGKLVRWPKTVIDEWAQNHQERSSLPENEVKYSRQALQSRSPK